MYPISQQIAVLNYHWRRTNMYIIDRPSGPRPNREQDTWTLGLRRKIPMKLTFFSFHLNWTQKYNLFFILTVVCHLTN